MSQRSEDLLAVLKSLYEIQRDFSGRIREVVAVLEGLVNAEEKSEAEGRADGHSVREVGQAQRNSACGLAAGCLTLNEARTELAEEDGGTDHLQATQETG